MISVHVSVIVFLYQHLCKIRHPRRRFCHGFLSFPWRTLRDSNSRPTASSSSPQYRHLVPQMIRREVIAMPLDHRRAGSRTKTGRFPRIFPGSKRHVLAPFCAILRGMFFALFANKSNFSCLMVGGTGIEPVTPPV